MPGAPWTWNLTNLVTGLRLLVENGVTILSRNESKHERAKHMKDVWFVP